MGNARGMSLIEILIVVAILAGLVGLALPRIKKNNTNIKSVMRELSVLSREVRHYARLKNATYRIVFTLNGNLNTEDSYFVEASNRAVLIKSEAKRKDEDSRSSLDKKENKSPFQKVEKPLKKEKQIPSGLFIKSVESRYSSEPVTKGTAYIHYSPEGLVEQSIVQITNGKGLTWSLIFQPLTGHADIVDKPISLKDLESQ